MLVSLQLMEQENNKKIKYETACNIKLQAYLITQRKDKYENTKFGSNIYNNNITNFNDINFICTKSSKDVKPTNII